MSHVGPEWLNLDVPASLSHWMGLSLKDIAWVSAAQAHPEGAESWGLSADHIPADVWAATLCVHYKPLIYIVP